MYRNLKFLHMTDFFSTDTVLVSVTNMRYVNNFLLLVSVTGGADLPHACLGGGHQGHEGSIKGCHLITCHSSKSSALCLCQRVFDSGHLMKNPLCVLLTQCDHRQRVESFPLIFRLFCQGSFWDNLNILR